MNKGNKIGRWNCHLCKSSFNVLSGTLFKGTKIPLAKWFMGIALMLDAKKSLSSCQLARHLGMNQMSAWSMMQKIRREMDRKGDTLLKGIIEADETYLSGKSRRRKNDRDELPPLVNVAEALVRHQYALQSSVVTRL